MRKAKTNEPDEKKPRAAAPRQEGAAKDEAPAAGGSDAREDAPDPEGEAPDESAEDPADPEEPSTAGEEAEDGDTPENDKAEDSAEKPGPEKQEKPEDAPAQPDPAEAAEDPEKAQLKADLLQARCKLAAYGAGVAPEKVADAVTLAVAQVQAAGDYVTEEAVAAAMQDVVKRNPEWKAAGGKKNTGSIRLGSDPDSRPAARKEKERAGNKKPWNKFNR